MWRYDMEVEKEHISHSPAELQLGYMITQGWSEAPSFEYCLKKEKRKKENTKEAFLHQHMSK